MTVSTVDRQVLANRRHKCQLFKPV